MSSLVILDPWSLGKPWRRWLKAHDFEQPQYLVSVEIETAPGGDTLTARREDGSEERRRVRMPPPSVKSTSRLGPRRRRR